MRYAVWASCLWWNIEQYSFVNFCLFSMSDILHFRHEFWFCVQNLISTFFSMRCKFDVNDDAIWTHCRVQVQNHYESWFCCFRFQMKFSTWHVSLTTSHHNFVDHFCWARAWACDYHIEWAFSGEYDLFKLCVNEGRQYDLIFHSFSVIDVVGPSSRVFDTEACFAVSFWPASLHLWCR